MPYELILMRSALFSGHGVGSRGTVNLSASHATEDCYHCPKGGGIFFFTFLRGDHSLLGLGSSNLMFGKMVRFSRDKVAFMTLVSAAALSLWPRFGLLCLVFSHENCK